MVEKLKNHRTYLDIPLLLTVRLCCLKIFEISVRSGSLTICIYFTDGRSMQQLVDCEKLPVCLAGNASYKRISDENTGSHFEAPTTDSFPCAKASIAAAANGNFCTSGTASGKSPTSLPTFVDYRYFWDARGLDAINGLEHGCAQPGIIRPVPIHHQPSTIRGHMPKLNVVLPQSGRLLKASECRNKPASSTTWLQTELKENDVYNGGKIREKQTEATANDEIMFVGMEARHDVLHKVEENKLFPRFQQNISSEDESSIIFSKSKSCWCGTDFSLHPHLISLYR